MMQTSIGNLQNNTVRCIGHTKMPWCGEFMDWNMGKHIGIKWTSANRKLWQEVRVQCGYRGDGPSIFILRIFSESFLKHSHSLILCRNKIYCNNKCNKFWCVRERERDRMCMRVCCCCVFLFCSHSLYPLFHWKLRPLTRSYTSHKIYFS